MELSKDKIYLKIKAFLGTFFASMIAIYMIFGFVAWGWSVGSWYWSIRLIHVALSAYIAYYYHGIFITIFSEETEDEYNFFYDASKRNDD